MPHRRGADVQYEEHQEPSREHPRGSDPLGAGPKEPAHKRTGY